MQFAASSGGRFVAQPHDPYVVFSVAFRLQRLVDLHDPQNLLELGLSPVDLQRPWRLKQARGERVLTQEIGRVLFDLGQAADSMMLVAWSLGIGSVPATVYEHDQARDLLGYPADQHCEFLISFGYPADPTDLTRPPKAGGRLPLTDLVHEERW